MVPKKSGSANTHTVDGGNPAPVDRYSIPFKMYRVLMGFKHPGGTGFLPSTVFSHTASLVDYHG